MTLIKVTLTAILCDTWDRLPKDRPIKLLVEDAVAMQRRASKGVNVAVQRGLFLQLARRVDALALFFGRTEKSVRAIGYDGAEAEAFLSIHREALASPESTQEEKKGFFAWIVSLFRRKAKAPKVSAWPTTRSPLESYFLPGDQVRVLSERYCAVAFSRGADALAQRVSQFLAELDPAQYAVVLTVSLRNPLSVGESE